MKYIVDVISNGAWFTYSKEIKDNNGDKTAKENFEKQKLVKDLVKENNVRGAK